MTQRLFIRERMPNLNNMLDAKSVVFGNRGKFGRGDAYNAMKIKWAKKIELLVLEQGIKPVSQAHFRFTWIEPARQSDPDNIVAARKFVLDGLVKAGILSNDGWKQVLSFSDRWIVNKECPGVVVDIVEPEIIL